MTSYITKESVSSTMSAIGTRAGAFYDKTIAPNKTRVAVVAAVAAVTLVGVAAYLRSGKKETPVSKPEALVLKTEASVSKTEEAPVVQAPVVSASVVASKGPSQQQINDANQVIAAQKKKGKTDTKTMRAAQEVLRVAQQQ